MIRRGLTIAAFLLGVFAMVGALTFPTDALVRGALARMPLPDGMQLTYGVVALRPNGLRFEDVHVVRRSGQPAFDAEWLRLWPSLWGFWRDRTGRPWSISAATCQGTVDVTVGVERRATPVAVALDHVELATCLPYVFPRIDAYGRVTGRFTVHVAAEDPSSSDGALELRGAAWAPGGPLEDARLHADAGSVRWTLADHRLEIANIETSSDDFHAVGHGSVRFGTPVDDSVLDLRLNVTPGRTVPPILRRYLEAIPGAPPDVHGTRTFRIQGTLRDPRVAAMGTLE